MPVVSLPQLYGMNGQAAAVAATVPTSANQHVVTGNKCVHVLLIECTSRELLKSQKRLHTIARLAIRSASTSRA